MKTKIANLISGIIGSISPIMKTLAKILTIFALAYLVITTIMIVIGKMNSPISLYIASIGILIIWIVAKTSKLLKAKILS
mgnify:FL=1